MKKKERKKAVTFWVCVLLMWSLLRMVWAVPYFTSAKTRLTVAENLPKGTPVGDPFTVGSPKVKGGILTYSIDSTSPSADLFSIDATTAQLKTAVVFDYDTVNYPTEGGFRLFLNVTEDIDSDGQVDRQHSGYVNPYIKITETLGWADGSSATREVAENTPAGRNIGDPISATGGLAPLTYTLTGTDAGSFDVDSTNGQLKTQAPLDYESKNSYTVQVGVTDTTSQTASIPVTINVLDRDDTPDLRPILPLTVSFANYPEGKPSDEFTLTLRFSEPVTGFEKNDIIVETELTHGKGTATLTALTPLTGPAQTYTATVKLPGRAIGTVRLIVNPGAATGSTSGIRGPLTVTASDPIEFGRRVRIICPASVVPMDTIIFNEFRNAEDDTHDWIELKNVSDEPVSLKDWEISIVSPHVVNFAASHLERIAMDRDVVAFPDVTLPAGGILLIVNTHPSETDLIRGQNIETPNYNPDIFPQFLIAPEMKLPSTRYLLILRSVRDKNGQWDGFEDLAGDYHHGPVGYRTQIWPLRCTHVYTGTGAQFSEGKVYQRVMTQRFLTYKGPRIVPEARGYLHEAWVPSEAQSGLGYDPGAPPETSLGTPGYSETVIKTAVGSGEISISEVMYVTDERASLSQWIELYNNSATEIVDLEGWTLIIEVRDSSHPVHRRIAFPFKSLVVMPRQTVLLVTRNGRDSGNIPMSRIYDVKRQHRKALLLREEGFALRLFSSDGTLVDMAGNLDGRRGSDRPRWELPSGWTASGERSSVIRRYQEGVALPGTLPGSWVRASDTALLVGYSYYGLPTDDGTPGYRQGSPLPVTLSSLRADLKDSAVIVNWTTAAEMENAGFHVLRSRDQASGFVQVNPALIPGAGTTAEGQTYTYRDTTSAVNVPYYYRLEEVSLSGERRAVATVRLRGHVSAANKRLWKWADVKSETK